MTGNLQPLDQKFSIVDADGKPTLYFIKWAQQRQIDIGEGISAEQALEIIEQYLADHQLQAGSGISLSPSGNIADIPTVAAEVQAILDQISTTHGTVLFRGAADWQALAPGTAGHFLKTNGPGADPEWAAGGGGGGAVLIQTITLVAPAPSVTFLAIPATFTNLRLIAHARQNAGAEDYLYLQFNGDTGANYQSYVENRFGMGTYTTFNRYGISESAGVAAGLFSPNDGWIYDYKDTTTFTRLLSQGFVSVANFIDRNGGHWKNTAPVTSILVRTSIGGNMAIGSTFSLYGEP